MKKLLVQLDADRLPSAFDRIVGYDAGADEVLSYGAVRPEDVEALVHGTIFTRGPAALKNTAIFVGGSDAEEADRQSAAVRESFFGPFRVSLMVDPNGNNTTAAAAVLKVVTALDAEVVGHRALILAGTGPVGTRAAGLLARLGASARITTRERGRGEVATRRIRERFGVDVSCVVATDAADTERALGDATLLLAAGPPGVPLLGRDAWAAGSAVRVAADVNAVPPAGLEGIEAKDDGEERNGVVTFGALGIGAFKMKVHKAALGRLFERNDLIMDTESIYELATGLS